MKLPRKLLPPSLAAASLLLLGVVSYGLIRGGDGGDVPPGAVPLPENMRRNLGLDGPLTPFPEYIATMRTVVTLSVLAASLYVILSKKYPPADRKWAYGAVGGIMAFWLAAGQL